MRNYFLVAVAVFGVFNGFSQSKSDKTKQTDSIHPFQSQELKEVKVTAKKRLIEQKLDKTIVNVDAAITNSGTTALDLLEKTPGVVVDKDGKISLKGKQGVMVMLDGRPTYLSDEQLANLLRGMQSSQLDQIEIMTNPPAKYDAAGNSGVINIKTKKNKTYGLNGSVTAGITQGKYFRTNESLSLNYREEKFNIFSNYSLSKNNNLRQLDVYRRYKNDDNSTRAIFDQVSKQRHTNLNHNLKLGIDYSPDKNTTLGIVFTGFYNPEKNSGKNISYLKNPQSVTDSILVSDSKTKELWKNGSINLNMRHTFDTTGQELSADIDVLAYNVTNRQNFTNTSYTPEMIQKEQDNLIGDIPMNISIYSAKIDYVHPFKNKMKLEAGWKSSYVITDSKAKYYNEEAGIAKPDYGKTNFFRYRENINAAYLNLNRKLSPKVEIQAGLRIENTNYNGLQHGNPTRTDSVFTKTYNSLFPTVYTSYAVNKNHQIGLSLGRRIDRPRYENLNPFMFFIDRYTYGKGNPYLKPEYTNNAEISHIFKGFLTTTLNYSYTRNLIGETFDQEGKYTTVQSNGNYGKRNNAGIAVAANFKISKWLNTNIYTNYNYTKMQGKLFGEDFKAQAGNINANINNQFNFSKGWSGEISGWYRSRGLEGQILINAMGALSTGIAKQVLDGKGIIKLTVRDIFYTQPASGTINFKTTEAYFHSSWDSRQGNLTFTYRFGKKLAGSPASSVKSIEEQRRVKGAE